MAAKYFTDRHAGSKRGARSSLPQVLAKRGLIPENIFSILLSSKQDESKFTLGGIPNHIRHLKDQIQYHPNVIKEAYSEYESDYWMIEFSKAELGSQTLDTQVSSVALDSGCTLN